jgi:hypothetical protein
MPLVGTRLQRIGPKAHVQHASLLFGELQRLGIKTADDVLDVAVRAEEEHPLPGIGAVGVTKLHKVWAFEKEAWHLETRAVEPISLNPIPVYK